MSEPSARIDRDFARNVDWNLLKTFLEIVRAGGIGAAARNLNRQQPSVSAALKRLEDQLGAQLFERSTAGVRITPAGRSLQTICEDLFETVRMAQHQVAQAMRRVAGVVRIQLISSVICAELDEAIASFRRAVELNPEDRKSEENLRALEEMRMRFS
jgi:DNA-binding transcriptional LysR family regulator